MTEQPKYFSKARVGNVTAATAILATIGLWIKVVIDLTSGNLVLETVADSGNIMLSPITGIILTILMLWALCFGLPIGDKTYNIDIFPPQIRVIDNAK